MRTFQTAVLEGDGIGPEVVAEGLRVLQVTAPKFDLHFECEHALQLAR